MDVLYIAILHPLNESNSLIHIRSYYILLFIVYSFLLKYLWRKYLVTPLIFRISSRFIKLIERKCQPIWRLNMTNDRIDLLETVTAIFDWYIINHRSIFLDSVSVKNILSKTP